MTATSNTYWPHTSFPFYPDVNGQALDGRAWFGEAYQNPVTHPITVYWDREGTQPAAQPIAISRGRTVRSDGTPARVWISGDYSALIRNKQGTQIAFEPTSPDNLGILLAAPDGAWRIGFEDGTVADRLNSMVETVLEANVTIFTQAVKSVEVRGYYKPGDGGAALYSRADTEPAHNGKFQSLDGAWWELASPVVRPEMLGAAGDAVANQRIMDSAMRCASLLSVPLEITRDVGVAGVVETRSNTIIDFKGGKLRQTKPSAVGAFLTNVTMDGNDRKQSDITIINPQIDGVDYLTPIILKLESVTATSFTFINTASDQDGAYNGLMFQGMTAGQVVGFITKYVGSTRTATLSVTLTVIPEVGTDVQIGSNDNPISTAWGAKRIKIVGGHLRNYPMSKMTIPGLGGKGVNFEQGNDDVSISGTTITNCYTGLYIAGMAGNTTTGAPRRVVGARASNIHGEFCGSFITLTNLDLVAGISPAVNETQISIVNCTYHNCGHAPLKISAPGYQAKIGVINLMGVNGATVGNIRGYNDDDYITQAGGYPTDYPARMGYGLSGPIGAVIWGHARNTKFYEIHHGGDVDAAVHIGRVRALGDDAPPTGVVTQLIGWDIDGLHVYGKVKNIVSHDTKTGFESSEVVGYWRIVVDDVTEGFVPSIFTHATNLVLDITRRSDNTRVIGRAKDILLRGNTFNDYIAGQTTDLRIIDRRRFAIELNGVVKIVPVRNQGRLRFNTADGVGGASNNWGEVVYSTFGGGSAVLVSGNYIEVGTTPLTQGTGDGVDGRWNIAAVVNDGIYIKNMLFTKRTIDVFLE